MLEPFVVLVIGLAVGITAGALSSIIGWIRTTEPFEGRKFATGVITGIIAGIAIVLANTQALQTAADESAILIQLIVMVLAILGVDTVRTAVAASIAKRAGAKEVR